MQFLKTFCEWCGGVGVVQAIFYGLCLGAGFINPFFWWLGIIAIVWCIHVLQIAQTLRKAILLLTIVWFIKALCSIIWLWTVYPIDWIGTLHSSIQIIIILFYWLTSSIWLASGGAVFAFFGYWLVRKLHGSPAITLIGLPILWVFAELAAAGVFSIFTAGPGSFIQTYFGFGMTGYLIGHTEMGIGMAAFAGLYGLSFLVVLMSIFLYVTKQRFSLKITFLVGICLYVSIIYITPNLPLLMSLDTTVIAIDTQFGYTFTDSEEGRVTKNLILREAIKKAVDLKPDFVLLPEDSRYYEVNFADASLNQAMAYFQFIHSGTDVTLIDSGRTTTLEGEVVLRANIFDGISKKIIQYDKQYLVPQGEFIPFFYGSLVRVLGYGSAVDRIAQDSAYRPGPLIQTSMGAEYVPGILFCFESVNPFSVKSLQKKRARPFIVHPISHSWFHQSYILEQQLDTMLLIQSRWSGVPIVSAGNQVNGKLYLPNGHIETGQTVAAGEVWRLQQFSF